MNNQTFYFFYNLAHQSNFIDNIIIFFAVYFPFIVVGLAFMFLLFHHEVLQAENPYQVFLQKKKEILLVFFSGTVAWILAFGLKLLFQIPRPPFALPDIQTLFLKTTFSFPSEHAMFFAALTFEIFLLHKKAGCIFLFFALLIALARIAAGVHFPADILAGIIFGFGVAYFVRKFSGRYFNI